MKGHLFLKKKKTLKKEKAVAFCAALITFVLLAGYLVLWKDEAPAVHAVNKLIAKNKQHVATAFHDNDGGRNHGSALSTAKLRLESINNVDKLTVIVPVKDDKIKYAYVWYVNEEKVATDADNITGFKKGDKIRVEITPSVGNVLGQPKVLAVEIANTTPKVVENKKISFDGKVLSYQVKAIDPNGGPLSYSLEDAPRGMSIDHQTGVIDWQVKQDEFGTRSIRVKIANKSGAETVYPLNLEVGPAAD
jgi:hypothetical protein